MENEDDLFFAEDGNLEDNKEYLARLGLIFEFIGTVELMMNHLIMFYFTNGDWERSPPFDDILIPELNYSQKLNIFKKILELDKIKDAHSISSLDIDFLYELKKIRNRCAHSMYFYSDDNSPIAAMYPNKGKIFDLTNDEELKKIRNRIIEIRCQEAKVLVYLMKNRDMIF